MVLNFEYIWDFVLENVVVATSFRKRKGGRGLDLPWLVTLAWERENKDEGICMLWADGILFHLYILPGMTFKILWFGLTPVNLLFNL